MAALGALGCPLLYSSHVSAEETGAWGVGRDWSKGPRGPDQALVSSLPVQATHSPWLTSWAFLWG